MRELLQAFGPLKSYNLVTDRETGASKGYAFCEYANPDMTEVALQVRRNLLVQEGKNEPMEAAGVLPEFNKECRPSS